MFSLFSSLFYLIGIPLLNRVLHRRWELWRSLFISWFVNLLWLISIFFLVFAVATSILVFRARNVVVITPPTYGCGSVVSPYLTGVPILLDDYHSDGVMSQGAHGQSYGHNAVDISAGGGHPVLAPIHGVVTRNDMDGLGNTILVIENDCYKVDLWHGNWNEFPVGTRLSQYQPVGAEWNNGYTMSNGRLCNGRVGCGNHTHMNVFDKRAGRNMDLTSILIRPLGHTAGEKPLRISWYDPIGLCDVLPINCWNGGKWFRNGELVTEGHYGNTAACIPRWLGRTVVIPELGLRLVCRDTGGAIVERDGYIWIDVLSHQHPAPGRAYVSGWFLED